MIGGGGLHGAYAVGETAQRQCKPVIGGVKGYAQKAGITLCDIDSAGGEYFHGGNIQGFYEGGACGYRAVVFIVKIIRAVTVKIFFSSIKTEAAVIFPVSSAGAYTSSGFITEPGRRRAETARLKHNRAQ